MRDEHDEEFESNLRMLRYYWNDKGDVTRWTGWKAFKKELEVQRPDILLIIKNYLDAKSAMNSAMENL